VRAHLLLVGDIDQLPSVGAGNVLKDLIAVGSSLADGRVRRPAPTLHAAGSPLSALRSPLPIPVTRLSFVYRQQKESLIVTTAHAINEGVNSPPPVVSEVAKAQAWSDLNFIAATGAEDCLAKVTELCAKFIPAHFKWFNPVTDVQVLAPMHKGVAGVANLNTALQAALRPWKVGVAVPRDASSAARGTAQPTLKTVSGSYEVGDKLIQLRNNYDKNLFNGDIGTVVSVDVAKGTLVADFDGEKHTFERGEFGDTALAYAVSIHKSQGSEYPVVIVVLLKAHFVMLQRNLIYTAITRGRKKVFIVGEPAAYGMAVRNAESKTRCTHLREKILAAPG
jgi:exodeoxyribonuclease V alpha subunit